MWTVENANNVLTSAQCRAARALLVLSQSRRHIRIRHRIRQVLESLGAEFEVGEVRDRRRITGS